MSTHFIKVCEFGYRHGQCRCASPNKTIRRVECNNINHARNPKVTEDDYVPKHRKEEDG